MVRMTPNWAGRSQWRVKNFNVFVLPRGGKSEVTSQRPLKNFIEKHIVCVANDQVPIVTSHYLMQLTLYSQGWALLVATIDSILDWCTGSEKWQRNEEGSVASKGKRIRQSKLERNKLKWRKLKHDEINKKASRTKSVTEAMNFFSWGNGRKGMFFIWLICIEYTMRLSIYWDGM